MASAVLFLSLVFAVACGFGWLAEKGGSTLSDGERRALGWITVAFLAVAVATLAWGGANRT